MVFFYTKRKNHVSISRPNTEINEPGPKHCHFRGEKNDIEKKLVTQLRHYTVATDVATLHRVGDRIGGTDDFYLLQRLSRN